MYFLNCSMTVKKVLLTATHKFKNLHFDGFALCISYKVLDEKVQKLCQKICLMTLRSDVKLKKNDWWLQN